MNSNPRIGAIIQCDYSDLYKSKKEQYYSISACKKSRIFNEIILVAPNTKKNKIFDNLSKKWGVKLVKGSIFNVAKRIAKADKRYKIDINARILLKSFYVDINLTKDSINLLKNNKADLISFPKDFNYELTATVFSTSALKSAIKLIKNHPNKDFYSFSPWQFIEDNKDKFNVLIHPGCPTYPKNKTKLIKEKLKKLREENQTQYGWNFPASSYAFASQFLPKKNLSILDIACGQGEGTRQLVKSKNQILGVDISNEYINKAKSLYNGVSNLKFELADASKFKGEKKFDVIISMHTLEHLSKPLKFLQLSKENLKANGKLIIEVPLLLPKPLQEPLYPFHKFEFTTKKLEILLTKAGFKTELKFGRSRGVYTSIDKAREAVQYHCRINTN